LYFLYRKIFFWDSPTPSPTVSKLDKLINPDPIDLNLNQASNFKIHIQSTLAGSRLKLKHTLLFFAPLAQPAPHKRFYHRFLKSMLGKWAMGAKKYKSLIKLLLSFHSFIKKHPICQHILP